ncbi:MAG: nitrogen fixation protein FixC [Elusimicrobia bacterium RIFCSPLOWO2_01_FULL_59_12]|nr:MAG: nitrogen fixation protein FixC [Elusimicrobia bacterium RIFCSPLOWO2_01_FULL_59_12]
MADEKFDSIVVGAGPAGVSAALTMAQAGLNVALLERGEYAGAKNVQGAVLYSKMLEDVVPEFWKDAPLERAIVEERLWVLTEDSGIQVGYKSAKYNSVPANCYTIIRVEFDKWFAKKAEAAGVTLITGVTVDDVLKKDGDIIGVKTTEGDRLLADVVIACDGANSIISQKAGLHREWKPEEVALGVKEVLFLPREKIEDRFNLEGDQGSTTEMLGDITQGMLGYAFLYTNKESLALGVGCAVDDFQRTRIKPYELLEEIKRHPMIRRLIAGSKTLEYSAHLIPEGGYNSMPPLYTGGMLLAGDAAQMINPTHREGSNLAMASGKLAAETVIEAKKRNNYSARSLGLYRKKLEESFVLKDMDDHKDIEEKVRQNRDIMTIYPKLACESAHEYFIVDGLPKRDHQRRIIRRIRRQRGIFQMIKDFMSLRHAIG